MFAPVPVTASVEAALDELLEYDWEASSDAELEDGLAALQVARNRLDAVTAIATAIWDLRRVWARHRCVNGAAWLTATLRLPSDLAHRQVRHARHLRHLPETMAALSEGSINSAQVQRIVSVDSSRTHEAVTAAEDEIVEWAKTETWRQFCRKVAEWVEDNDPDGPHRDRGARRRFHFSQTFQNGWAADGWFDPIRGTVVHTELERLERQLFDADWAEAKARLGRDPLPGELGRTPAQRRADALVLMAENSASKDNGRRPEPLVIILVGVAGFERSCELLDGTVLSPYEVSEVLSQSVIQRITFDGPDNPVTASPQRNFTGILRRVLDVRDRWCTDPLCDVPAERCQGDHVIPYAAGGPTSIENGRLQCGHHNRLRNTRSGDDDPPS